MVTEAGEKAKLVAVMVTVAVGGAVVAVVATVVVVVVAVVVVAARVVVVVGAREVVVDAIVVVGGWVVLVVEAVVVVTLVVEGDAVVEVGDGAVVDVVNVTSRESSVTPVVQAVRNNAKTSSWLRRIPVIRMEHDDRFSCATVTPDRMSPRVGQGDRRRCLQAAREKAPTSGAFSPEHFWGQPPLPRSPT